MFCITIGKLPLASPRKRHDTSKDKLVLTDQDVNEMKTASKSVNIDEQHDCKTYSLLTGSIRIKCPCNLHPLTPIFYIVKLGSTRIYNFSSISYKT